MSLVVPKKGLSLFNKEMTVRKGVISTGERNLSADLYRSLGAREVIPEKSILLNRSRILRDQQNLIVRK